MNRLVLSSRPVAFLTVFSILFSLAAGAAEPPRGPGATIKTGSAARETLRGQQAGETPSRVPPRDPAPPAEPAEPSGLRLCPEPPPGLPPAEGCAPRPVALAPRTAPPPPSAPEPGPTAGDFTVSIPSHYAGFASNYPHDDGVSYNVYNSVNEKIPLWGLASGGPAPGVAASLWVGGDFDAEISSVPCNQSASCLIPPPVDGVYRGWRTQGYNAGPCHCPTAIQGAYFSANRGLAMFDLWAVPDRAAVSHVAFEGKVSKAFGSGERLNLSRVDADRSEGHENLSGTGFVFAYDDASDGHLYLTSWNVAPYAIGNPARTDLNATALADVRTALSDNWFGLGLVSSAGETLGTAYYFGAFEGSGAATPPVLLLDYHYVVPDAPSRNDLGFGEPAPRAECLPLLTWDIPDEADGRPLHFSLLLSDTGPVDFAEDFRSLNHLDLAQTSYASMVKTGRHDLYDGTGAPAGTDPPHVRLDPLELNYGGAVYPYGKGYNVGWKYGRPFVSFLASDTYTSGGYRVAGLGDGMMGRTYMEWSSNSAIAYPDTACATVLGYPANITLVGGYLPAGLSESFEVAVEYDGDPGNYYTAATVSGAQDAFSVEFDPPLQSVTSVGLFFQSSNDGYAYLADLQIYDSLIYDTSETQVVTSARVADTLNPAVAITHATLSATHDIPSGTAVVYRMSNDDGATWSTVTPGADFTFPGTGGRLRWRAELSTSDRALTPRLLSVSVRNLLAGGPITSQAAPALFEENATLGGIYQTLPVAGAPERQGVVRQARYHAASLPDGAYRWAVRAYAPAGSGDPSSTSPAWPFTVDSTDATPPAPVGDTLRGSKTLTDGAHFTWADYPGEPGAHFHVYRSDSPLLTDPVVFEAFARGHVDATPPPGLVFYNILAADDCENETTN